MLHCFYASMEDRKNLLVGMLYALHILREII